MEIKVDWVERDMIVLALQEFIANNKGNDDYYEEVPMMKKLLKKINKTIAVVD